jgi:glucan phosphorylase
VSESRIAYFSMEIALHPAMPTYSGGLGMLAGDMLRAAADRELPMVAVTLLHRKGYFYQTLDGSGWQTEASVEWIVEDFLRELPHRAAVTLEGSTIQLRAWQYDVRGATGAMVPVYLLTSCTTIFACGEDRGLGRFLCTLEKRDGGGAVSWSRAGWTERTRKTMPKTTRH